MDDFTLTILIIVAGFVVILYFVKKWLSQPQESMRQLGKDLEWLRDSQKETRDRLSQSTETIDKKLGQSMRDFNKRLDKAAEVISKVQKNIGEFSEIGRGMKELQEFLQSPKLRGNIGEQVLKDLLTQFLPKGTFKLQYSFKNGEKVDAVVKASQGLIPIDSKFPMANFRKMMSEEEKSEREHSKKDFANDVKKHINNIAKKYIVVEEGTVDYAIMYIPSESVYYEIINDQNLFDYAGSRRVLPTSPMSFYAYLKAILMSFEGQKIEKRAKEILATLQAMKKDYEKVDDALSILNRHVTNAYNQMNNVTKFFLSLGQKITSSRLIEGGEETEQLELKEKVS